MFRRGIEGSCTFGDHEWETPFRSHVHGSPFGWDCEESNRIHYLFLSAVRDMLFISLKNNQHSLSHTLSERSFGLLYPPR